MSVQTTLLTKTILDCALIKAHFPDEFQPNGLSIVKFELDDSKEIVQNNYTVFYGVEDLINSSTLPIRPVDTMIHFTCAIFRVPPEENSVILQRKLTTGHHFCSIFAPEEIRIQYYVGEVHQLPQCYEINHSSLNYIEKTRKMWVYRKYHMMERPETGLVDLTIREDVEMIYAETPEGKCVQAKFEPYEEWKWEDCEVIPFKVFKMNETLNITQYFSLHHLHRITMGKGCNLSMGLDQIARKNIHIRFIYLDDQKAKHDAARLRFLLIFALAIGIPAFLILAGAIGGFLYWKLVKSQKINGDPDPATSTGSKMTALSANQTSSNYDIKN